MKPPVFYEVEYKEFDPSELGGSKGDPHYWYTYFHFFMPTDSDAGYEKHEFYQHRDRRHEVYGVKQIVPKEFWLTKTPLEMWDWLHQQSIDKMLNDGGQHFGALEYEQHKMTNEYPARRVLAQYDKQAIPLMIERLENRIAELKAALVEPGT